MSRVAPVLASLAVALGALVIPGPARPADDAAAARQAEEDAYCADEIRMIANRQRLFEGQGLPPFVIKQKNAPAQQALDECRAKFRREKKAEADFAADEAEALARAGPRATAEERIRAWKEVRRERLAAKRPSELTPEERAELAAGATDEMKATHEALDRAHASDPSFMRIAHGALACYHRQRQERLIDLISQEENLLKLGTGDRQRLYTLQSDKRISDEVVTQVDQAARRYAGGLPRCDDRQIAVLSHCLALRTEGGRRQPQCEAEEIQQYLRLVK